MEWNPTWEDPLRSYVKQFDGLMGDHRTRKTFGEVVKGILAAGSLICQQIAARSAELSKGKKGSQRVIRLATGESTQRSELDAEHLTQRLREVAVEQLAQVPEDELWLIADRSDLRKPYAEAMPYLMEVRDLDEQWVPGYCTLNVIGLTPGRRGLLYHRLFSSQAPEFVSEPKEGFSLIFCAGRAYWQSFLFRCPLSEQIKGFQHSADEIFAHKMTETQLSSWHRGLMLGDLSGKRGSQE